MNQYDSAHYYAIKGLKLKTEKTSIASKNDVANSRSNQGNIYCALKDRKSVVQGKSVDLGGRRIIKKKNKEEKEKEKKYRM